MYISKASKKRNSMEEIVEYYVTRLKERFWHSVEKTENCWNWVGAQNKRGYGVFSCCGRVHYPHRISYILEHGFIPEGKFILHSCDNRKCVRPSHLSAGTNTENMADMVSKKRHCFGKKHYRAVLTEKDVREIRSNTDLSHNKLAKKYGVSRRNIRSIIYKETWKHF